MLYVVKRVRDWKNTRSMRNLNTFQLDNTDRARYQRRLFGFTHGTNPDGLEAILDSGKIISSFNLRQAQIQDGLKTTGGDRGHDGQYTVYFRFVEKKNSTHSIPNAIVRSLGGVGSSSGCVLFVSLDKIVQSRICFALAGGIDGLRGTNCFTQQKLDQFKARYNGREAYSEVLLGKSQFELGLSAAEGNARGNEIGFFNEIDLQNVEVIMLRNGGRTTIPNYTALAAPYRPATGRVSWTIFQRNGSTLNLYP